MGIYRVSRLFFGVPGMVLLLLSEALEHRLIVGSDICGSLDLQFEKIHSE